MKILQALFGFILAVAVFVAMSMVVAAINLWSVNTLLGRVIVPITWATTFAGAWLVLGLGWLTGADKKIRGE